MGIIPVYQRNPAVIEKLFFIIQIFFNLRFAKMRKEMTGGDTGKNKKKKAKAVKA